MLRVKNLKKVYESKSHIQTVALNDINIDFGDKGLVFILGKSGSGKSTLLNLLGGIDAPTDGEIIVDDRSSVDFREKEFDEYRNTYIGFVFQEYNLIPEYTVGQNIALAIELQSKKADRLEIDGILRRVELVDGNGNTLFDRKIDELSGGQKQRVAIARALVKNPKIILADEPTGALDATTGESLYFLLRQLSENRLVIVVTHDIDSANQFGDRIIHIADGRVIEDTIDELRSANLNRTKELESKIGFVKGKLPLKRCFTMGVRALNHKKLRLAISILLSVFMCFIFGFSFTAATVDELSTQIKAMKDNNIKLALIQAESKYPIADAFGLKYWEDWNELSLQQQQAIEKYYDVAMPVVSFPRNSSSPITFAPHIAYEFDETSAWMPQELNPYLKMIWGNTPCIEIDPSTETWRTILTPDSRFLDKSVCRLPNDLTEIAIADGKADIFMRFGYRDEEGNVITINTPDDLIGRKIGSYKIVGVYETEEDRSAIKERYDFDYTTPNWDDLKFRQAITYASGFHSMGMVFVSKGFTAAFWGVEKDKTPVSQYLVRLSGKDKKFLRGEEMTYIGSSDDGYINELHYSVGLYSRYAGNIEEAAYIFTDDTFLTVMWWVGGVFSVVSALLIMNYLSVTIELRKRELGILRALGARKADVVLICLFESLLIAAAIFVLALIATFVWCALVNGYYGIPLFIVGLVPILFLALLCFGVAALATTLPVYRIAKRKPVEIIQ